MILKEAKIKKSIWGSWYNQKYRPDVSAKISNGFISKNIVGILNFWGIRQSTRGRNSTCYVWGY